MHSLSTTDETMLPRRPGYGTAGEKVVVRANFFPLDIVKEDIKLYRYDIAILPQGGSANEEDAATGKMAKARRRQFVTIFMANPLFQTVNWATDYARLVITDRKLALPEDGMLKIKVPYHDPEELALPDASANEPAELTQRRNKRSRWMRIMPAGNLQWLSVQDFLQIVSSGRQGNYYPGKDEIIQAYNIIINSAVLKAQNNPVTQIGQNKFYPYVEGFLRQFQGLGQGLEALRGYSSSLRVGANRLLLNVNVTAGAFHSSASLQTLVNEFAGNDRSQSTLNRLNMFLKGLKIKTKYIMERGQRVIQVRKISRIAPKPDGALGGNSLETKFSSRDGNGREVNISVQEYFHQSEWMQLCSVTRLIIPRVRLQDLKS